jgi:hypothetical protein
VPVPGDRVGGAGGPQPLADLTADQVRHVARIAFRSLRAR